MRQRRRGSAFILVVMLIGASIWAVMSMPSVRNIKGRNNIEIQDWFNLFLPIQSRTDLAAETLVSSFILVEAAPLKGSMPILMKKERDVWRTTQQNANLLAQCLAVSDGRVGKEYGLLFKGYFCKDYGFLVPVYQKQRAFGYGTSAVLAVQRDEYGRDIQKKLDELWMLIQDKLEQAIYWNKRFKR